VAVVVNRRHAAGLKGKSPGSANRRGIMKTSSIEYGKSTNCANGW
jgi:hypothetical protein